MAHRAQRGRTDKNLVACHLYPSLLMPIWRVGNFRSSRLADGWSVPGNHSSRPPGRSHPGPGCRLIGCVHIPGTFIPGTFMSRVLATFSKQLSAKNLTRRKFVTCHIVTSSNPAVDTTIFVSNLHCAR